MRQGEENLKDKAESKKDEKTGKPETIGITEDKTETIGTEEPNKEDQREPTTEKKEDLLKKERMRNSKDDQEDTDKVIK
jgi:hypothetical protein